MSEATSAIDANLQQPRERKVRKRRRGELHLSSIPQGEPKNALTESQAKDADRYLQLWVVTTVEELNTFLDKYAPLAVESRILSAFMTWMGVFMWNRVPMGIKRPEDGVKAC